jgi:hypothetical protein
MSQANLSGYSKMKMLQTVGVKECSMSIVASTAGSKHPLIPSKDTCDFIEKRFLLKLIISSR